MNPETIHAVQGETDGFEHGMGPSVLEQSENLLHNDTTIKNTIIII
jgi:hypothetical protein